VNEGVFRDASGVDDTSDGRKRQIVECLLEILTSAGLAEIQRDGVDGNSQSFDGLDLVDDVGVGAAGRIRPGGPQW